MPPDKSDPAYLYDILESARLITKSVSGHSLDTYLEDRVLQLAVERLIEIIGEAARNVSEDFKKRHPEIPWRSIIAQRHVLAHEYGDVQQDRIWKVATVYIPELIKMLEPLTPEPPVE